MDNSHLSPANCFTNPFLTYMMVKLAEVVNMRPLCLVGLVCGNMGGRSNESRFLLIFFEFRNLKGDQIPGFNEEEFLSSQFVDNFVDCQHMGSGFQHAYVNFCNPPCLMGQGVFSPVPLGRMERQIIDIDLKKIRRDKMFYILCDFKGFSSFCVVLKDSEVVVVILVET